MSGEALTAGSEQRLWGTAAAVAFAVHAAAAAVALVTVGRADPPVPEPVVLVELPPAAAPAAVQSASEPVEQQAAEPLAPQLPTPPIDIPPVRAPLPRDPVVLPPPTPPQPVRQVENRPAPASAQVQPSAAPASRPVVPAAAPSTGGGTDPRAKKQEADYFSLLSAHLNRRKSYPAEARKARQEGIVTIRFTVDRSGTVSGAGIKSSSGHALLDDATLSLLQRVAPLPKFPASMERDSVTLSLPIAYSLRTD